MQVRFSVEHQSSTTLYKRHKIYEAASIEDDGSGLLDIYFLSGDSLIGIPKTDLETFLPKSEQIKVIPNPQAKPCCPGKVRV